MDKRDACLVDVAGGWISRREALVSAKSKAEPAIKRMKLAAVSVGSEGHGCADCGAYGLSGGHSGSETRRHTGEC